MTRNTSRGVATLPILLTTLGSIAQPAQAKLNRGYQAVPQPMYIIPENCSIPEQMQPLFNLIETFVELGFLLGMLLAVGGLVYAGLLYIVGGPEGRQRSKQVAVMTIKGVLIILLAPTVVSMIITQLNPYC
jgi:type IV secretory pathway VirB2 component (pilin)